MKTKPIIVIHAHIFTQNDFYIYLSANAKNDDKFNFKILSKCKKSLEQY